MNKLKPVIFTQCNELLCDWRFKKSYIFLYRMLKFYVRNAMIVDKVYEAISFRQSKWLEKFISFDSPKRSQAVTDFDKCFYKLVSNAFYGKAMENVRKGTNIEFIREGHFEKLIEKQSKLTFNGIHMSFEN